jgi:hypothetical protein
VSPVKYTLGFYTPQDDILHSHCREKTPILHSFPPETSSVLATADHVIALTNCIKLLCDNSDSKN